jgi:hypothetical protein
MFGQRLGVTEDLDEYCRAYFDAWLREYQGSQEPADLQMAGVREFHGRFTRNQLTVEELGCLIDLVMEV